jgi:hypothetical protein
VSPVGDAARDPIVELAPLGGVDDDTRGQR